MLGNCMPLLYDLVALVLGKLKGGKPDLVVLGYLWMIVLFLLLCTLVSEFVGTWSGLVAVVIEKIPSLVWTLLYCPDEFVAPVRVAVPPAVVDQLVAGFGAFVAAAAIVFVPVGPYNFS